MCLASPSSFVKAIVSLTIFMFSSLLDLHSSFFAQDTLNLPNVSITSFMYELDVQNLKLIDSAWYKCSNEELISRAEMGMDTIDSKGYWLPNYQWVDSLIEKTEYYQNILIDFKKRKIILFGDEAIWESEIISISRNELTALDALEYNFWTYDEQYGYYTWIIDFSKKSLQCFFDIYVQKWPNAVFIAF